MFTSKTDTLVQAVHDGLVIAVRRIPEASSYDVLLEFKTYLFWYAGIIIPKVKQGIRVKAGDIMGTYRTGDLIELQVYQNEEPINPRKYLKCK